MPSPPTRQHNARVKSGYVRRLAHKQRTSGSSSHGPRPGRLLPDCQSA
jgi:hypothetical protein